MALTKTIVDDKIEIVTEFKHLQIRTATVVKEDGAELSRTFHRRVLHCGRLTGDKVWNETDVSSESTEIKAIAAAVWTQSIKDAYKSSLESEYDAKTS
tara:strand:+ start:145 stop:438 length:294 start_codon:yes stop_codon:yes gene_type:complete